MPSELEPAIQSPGHAASEVRIGGFIIFLIGFILFGIGVHLTVYYCYSWLMFHRQTVPASPLSQAIPSPPDPQLEGSPPHPNLPQTDLRAMREREERQLTAYGWIDRSSGVVHIPIKQAMKIVVERGLPHAPPTTATAPR